MIKTNAIEKLKDELGKAKDKTFAEPVLSYLIKRCEEDNGLAEDVCQEHKTWDKCYSYIYKQAQEFAKGQRSCAVRDDVVYEWAEDYYHKDDKAEEEEKARQEEERKKKEAERKALLEKKNTDNKKSVDAEKVDEVSKPVEKKAEQKASVTTVVKREEFKPKKNGIDGQMDLFALMGM